MADTTEHQDLLRQIGGVAKDVGEVKIQVEKVNGKIDALTARQADNWTNVLSRIEFSERAAQQAATSLNDRINAEVKRADERHLDLDKQLQGAAERLDLRIDQIEKEDLRAIKEEVAANAAWRNKVIGWSAAFALIFSFVASLVMKTVE